VRATAAVGRAGGRYAASAAAAQHTRVPQLLLPGLPLLIALCLCKHSSSHAAATPRLTAACAAGANVVVPHTPTT
jgi:hypothetical protein